MLRRFFLGSLILTTCFLSLEVQAKSQQVMNYSFNFKAPQENQYFDKIKNSSSATDKQEAAKILYLITQLKTSPYRFQRNGTIYSGARAASHLMMKYGATKSRIKTADQFIDHLASRSSVSGNPYYVIDEAGGLHQSREVFLSELKELEIALAKTK